MAKLMANVQSLGRTLMLPIAVLPVAAILLRIGQPDLLDIAFIAAAGDAIFANLGMLFAIGIAVGFAKENHGAAGLAGLVGYLVAINGVQTLVNVPADILVEVSDKLKGMVESTYKVGQVKSLRVPIGITSGIIAGVLYNKYSNIKLPEFLAFFGGRRFVPIAAGLCGVLVAAVFGYGFPYISAGLDTFSQSVVNAGGFGLFVFGVLNRLLIVTGLHHILNNVAWFIVGDFNGVTGDLNRFFAGDESAGAFMSGFFPVMMFGLPAACYAMYRSAQKERRKEVGGMYMSLGLTSLLTGVTEPIEFTFMFLAPLLYAIHAVLTGVSMALMDYLNVRLGFGFSAGLFDYVLNFNKATKPLWLFPIGAVYALIYYYVFRFFIVKFNMKVPGRDDVSVTAQASENSPSENSKANGFIRALGGAENLEEVAACTTRLRLVLKDNTAINDAVLKDLGARGVIRPSSTTAQVVIGPTAEILADEIKQALKAGLNDEQQTVSPIVAPQSVAASGEDDSIAPDSDTITAYLQALGGAKNIISIKPSSSRLVLNLRNGKLVDENKLTSIGARGFVKLADDTYHLLLGPSAENIGTALQKLV